MNCKHPTLYVLGPENKPAPYGYCILCEVARLTADIATLERRERSRNNRIAELEDALPALDTRKAKCETCGDSGYVPAMIETATGMEACPYIGDPCPDCSPAPRDGRQGECNCGFSTGDTGFHQLWCRHYAPAATAEQGGEAL